MAINVKIALRVGSAMAWNMSCFIFQYLVAQLSGCKYICNFQAAQIYLQLFFFEVKCREVLVVVGGFVTMTPNGDGLSTVVEFEDRPTKQAADNNNTEVDNILPPYCQPPF